MTATLTQQVTAVETAFKTKTEVEKMTVTQLSTVVQPTTITSVWVSKEIVDKASGISRNIQYQYS